jgi:hypothetical protein
MCQVSHPIALLTIFYAESATTRSLDIVSGCTGIITAVPAVSPKKT